MFWTIQTRAEHSIPYTTLIVAFVHGPEGDGRFINGHYYE